MIGIVVIRESGLTIIELELELGPVTKKHTYGMLTLTVILTLKPDPNPNTKPNSNPTHPSKPH